jgi:hypothetical protein
MFEDSIKSKVTFTHAQYDENGNQTVHIERSLFDDEAEFLPTILNEFRYFLQGMTFSYVENIVAVDDEGGEVGSTES